MDTMVDYWKVVWGVAAFGLLATWPLPREGMRWRIGTAVSALFAFASVLAIAYERPSPDIANWISGPAIFSLLLCGGFLMQQIRSRT